MFNTNRLAKFLETGEMPLVTALDEAIANYKPTDLESHDKRFHPDGYIEGDACKYREGMAKKDDADVLSEKKTVSGSELKMNIIEAIKGGNDKDIVSSISGLLNGVKGLDDNSIGWIRNRMDSAGNKYEAKSKMVRILDGIRAKNAPDENWQNDISDKVQDIVSNEDKSYVADMVLSLIGNAYMAGDKAVENMIDGVSKVNEQSKISNALTEGLMYLTKKMSRTRHYREGMAEGDKTDEGFGGDKEQAKPQDDDMPTGTIVTIKDSHLRYGGERGEIVGNHKYGYKVKLVDRQDKPIVELQANQVAEKV